jgi:TonB family protein
MRLWKATYAETPQLGTSPLVSAALHGGVIVAAIASTVAAAGRVVQRIAARVQFPPPPDRVLVPSWGAETLHFVTLPSHAGMGLGKRGPATHAAPAYPPALPAKHVEGAVATTYAVDTTGVADTAAVVIVSATDTGFARSVRDALPCMRFRPAVRSNRKVRQLVSQTFVFKILHPVPDSTAIKKARSA